MTSAAQRWRNPLGDLAFHSASENTIICPNLIFSARTPSRVYAVLGRTTLLRLPNLPPNIECFPAIQRSLFYPYGLLRQNPSFHILCYSLPGFRLLFNSDQHKKNIILFCVPKSHYIAILVLPNGCFASRAT